MSELIQLGSARARQARLGLKIGLNGYRLLVILGSLAAIGSVAVRIINHPRISFLMAAAALLCYLPAIWWKRQLSVVAASGSDLNGRMGADVLARLKPGILLQPQSLWLAIADHWQTNFIVNHLFLSKKQIASQLSTEPVDLDRALRLAEQLADKNKSPNIEIGFVAAGLLLTSPAILQQLTQQKAKPGDIEAITDWLGRYLDDSRFGKQNYGGIARDWSFGYTPLLDRFGYNVSRGIMKHSAHFGWLTKSTGVMSIESAFGSNSKAIALVGPDGIGKTSTVYAFAQRLIEGKTAKSLAYHQIISLNATDITSRAQKSGDLEHIMLTLVNEAAHAGHVILFFDNAQLFLGDGHGSFDGSQILLSIVEAKIVPIILALTPNDFQRLKSSNPSLAGHLTPIILQELPESGVMRVLEDTSVGLENQHRVLIAYEALHEAYRLSGRYEQDEAYPGKAIKLLELAVGHADHSVVSAASVQLAIEQTRGVKASSAAPAETDALLHLEDNIHQRMINQAHAVSVVSNALRRARAGVTNPRRPIGSFLFLGPTGVGKTELAKSIAAVYFGSESNMIRLDMSEYQRPDDVRRLLTTGQSDSASLLMEVRQQPFSVVLLDEIEKAHPNILNLLLQMLDEGRLTDISGRTASFNDCVIIATSNAGAQSIRERVSRGESLESFSGEFTDELIKSNQFKPELLNRFDEMVLFRPLNTEELAKVVKLMLGEVNQTLTNQNISVELTDAAIAIIVGQASDPRLGARPMRRALQRTVEDVVAQKILRGQANPGDHLVLDAPDLAK